MKGLTDPETLQALACREGLSLAADHYYNVFEYILTVAMFFAVLRTMAWAPTATSSRR
jgi:hypothetical protein